MMEFMERNAQFYNLSEQCLNKKGLLSRIMTDIMMTGTRLFKKPPSHFALYSYKKMLHNYPKQI